MKESYRSP